MNLKQQKDLILRRPQTPFFATGSKAPLSINPEPSTRAQAEGQPPGVRPGIVEGLIYSLGTSNWTPGEFLDLFAEHGIEVGVDIRSFPISRHPHFIKEPLQNLLESTGIRYEYLGKELGGFRKGGYPAYMETDSFRKGLERLEEIGRGRRSAFFCAENIPGGATGPGGKEIDRKRMEGHPYHRERKSLGPTERRS